jgi:hypothetical protein
VQLTEQRIPQIEGVTIEDTVPWACKHLFDLSRQVALFYVEDLAMQHNDDLQCSYHTCPFPRLMQKVAETASQSPENRAQLKTVVTDDFVIRWFFQQLQEQNVLNYNLDENNVLDTVKNDINTGVGKLIRKMRNLEANASEMNNMLEPPKQLKGYKEMMDMDYAELRNFMDNDVTDFIEDVYRTITAAGVDVESLRGMGGVELDNMDKLADRLVQQFQDLWMEMHPNRDDVPPMAVQVVRT